MTISVCRQQVRPHRLQPRRTAGMCAVSAGPSVTLCGPREAWTSRGSNAPRKDHAHSPRQIRMFASSAACIVMRQRGPRAPAHLPALVPGPVCSAWHQRHTEMDMLVKTHFTSSLFQCEGVAFLFIVELSHELKEQMLKLRQAVAATISHVLKVPFERAKPLLHRGAAFDE
jgi:hypothetical protein